MLIHTTAMGIHSEKQRNLRKAVDRSESRKPRIEKSTVMTACADWIGSMADSISITNRRARPAA